MDEIALFAFKLIEKEIDQVIFALNFIEETAMERNDDRAVSDCKYAKLSADCLKSSLDDYFRAMTKVREFSDL